MAIATPPLKSLPLRLRPTMGTLPLALSPSPNAMAFFPILGFSRSLIWVWISRVLRAKSKDVIGAAKEIKEKEKEKGLSVEGASIIDVRIGSSSSSSSSVGGEGGGVIPGWCGGGRNWLRIEL